MKKAPEGAFSEVQRTNKNHFFFATTRIISRHWWA